MKYAHSRLLLVGSLRLSFQVTTTATAVVASTARCLTAIDDVFFLNGSTRALVNFLRTDLGGKLLTELHVDRCAETALALVGGRHLGRGHRNFAGLLVLLCSSLGRSALNIS